MIHLEKYTEAFEDEYYETVQAKIGEGRFDQLIEISKKLLPEGFYTSGKSEAETLILADYSKIRAACNCIENKKNQGIPLISEEEKEALENYQKEFGKVMAAEKNKRKLNVRLVQASGIRICPYCNRDYINSRGKKIAGAELDHFYSRKDYPVFALSLYNLVPCCGTCNRIKSNKLRAIVSPFDDKADFNQSVKFSYDKKAREVKLEGSKEHIQMFHLQEAYEIHSEEAEELLEKKMAYNTSQLGEILDLLDKNGKIITMEKLKEDIFGKYMDNNEFGKRPLAKFYHDILEQS